VAIDTRILVDGSLNVEFSMQWVFIGLARLRHSAVFDAPAKQQNRRGAERLLKLRFVQSILLLNS
jgi:hypothetical protein